MFIFSDALNYPRLNVLSSQLLLFGIIATHTEYIPQRKLSIFCLPLISICSFKIQLGF